MRKLSSLVATAAAVALGLSAPASAGAITVSRVGYATPSGAVADRAAYDKVIEAEDLVRAGQYSGYTIVAPPPVEWMIWEMSVGASVFGTITEPTDTIVFQTAGSDYNDGAMQVWVDGKLLDTVDVYPAVSLGTPFYVEVSGLPVQAHAFKVASVQSPSAVWPYHLHFDFVAAKRSNLAPIVTASRVATVEGTLAANVIAASDPNGDALTVTASAGTLVPKGQGEWLWTATYADGPSSHVVEVTADDGVGGVATTAFTVEVANAAPAITDFAGTGAPLAVGAVAAATGAFSDAGALDTHTAVVDWGDGTSSPADVVEQGGAGTFTASHAYAQPGLYTLRVVVTDRDGGVASSEWSRVVVYDPSGAFVTGGGWFASPEGALAAQPALGGRASFGFVVRYARDASAPTGNLELHLDGKLLTFKATSFDWLVVSGGDATVAGEGTVDGGETYAFTAVARDGGNGGPDAFGLELRDAAGEVVYASGPQPLGGGSVQVH